MAEYITRKDLKDAIVVEITVADGVVVHYYTNNDRRELSWTERFSVKKSTQALVAYCKGLGIVVRQ